MLPTYTFETDIDIFLKQFNENGFVVVPPIFDLTLLTKLRATMLELIDVEKELINKENYKDYGFLLCAPYYADKHPEILDILNNDIYLKLIESILEKWFTIYLYTNNCIPPNNGITKAVRIHVDTPRNIKDYNYLVGTLILLDDFTEENGATWFLPKSHKSTEVPTEEYFYKNAVRLIAPKGSVVFFNPCTWHTAGTNHTNDWRNCIIIAYSKPWIKQRVDIPRFMQHIDKSAISPHIKQLLGFEATPPSNFTEFYGDEGQRTYTQPFV